MVKYYIRNLGFGEKRRKTLPIKFKTEKEAMNYIKKYFGRLDTPTIIKKNK